MIVLSPTGGLQHSSDPITTGRFKAVLRVVKPKAKPSGTVIFPMGASYSYISPGNRVPDEEAALLRWVGINMVNVCGG
jgi:hypothetical protein